MAEACAGRRGSAPRSGIPADLRRGPRKTSWTEAASAITSPDAGGTGCDAADAEYRPAHRPVPDRARDRRRGHGRGVSGGARRRVPAEGGDQAACAAAWIRAWWFRASGTSGRSWRASTIRISRGCWMAARPDDGQPYFVMEYVEGVPDRRVLRPARPFASADRLKLFREVCAAVQYAHQNLVVHRDLKPGNILVTPDGTPKLLDFGIAKLLRHRGGTWRRPLTQAGTRLMTPEYASPGTGAGLAGHDGHRRLLAGRGAVRIAGGRHAVRVLSRGRSSRWSG